MSKDKGAKRPPLIFAEDMTDEMMEFTIETTKVRRYWRRVGGWSPY
jgi:hypothetical protein